MYQIHSALRTPISAFWVYALNNCLKTHACNHYSFFQIVKTSSRDALKKLLLCLRQRYSYRDPEALDCYRRIREIPIEELAEKVFIIQNVTKRSPIV